MRKIKIILNWKFLDRFIILLRGRSNKKRKKKQHSIVFTKEHERAVQNNLWGMYSTAIEYYQAQTQRGTKENIVLRVDMIKPYQKNLIELK